MNDFSTKLSWKCSLGWTSSDLKGEKMILKDGREEVFDSYCVPALVIG